ncbi:MAG: ribosomal protein S18-alanine N-acetyltransferase [Clostridia bacterium]|nr:ribosomal protein S18-alanine N-acetyltransferase [Clostridia bacterium]
MQIRKWEYKDILRISQIETECFPKEPWNFQMLASSFETESFHGVLAEDGGEIIGYGGITVAAESADIDNVAVTEPYRNSGVGTAIIEELLRIAKDCGASKVFLEVRVSNATAMKLYLKSGFKGAYARTRYYSDGEDCLVMVKEL